MNRSTWNVVHALSVPPCSRVSRSWPSERASRIGRSLPLGSLCCWWVLRLGFRRWRDLRPSESRPSTSLAARGRPPDDPERQSVHQVCREYRPRSSRAVLGRWRQYAQRGDPAEVAGGPDDERPREREELWNRRADPRHQASEGSPAGRPECNMHSTCDDVLLALRRRCARRFRASLDDRGRDRSFPAGCGPLPARSQAC